MISLYIKDDLLLKWTVVKLKKISKQNYYPHCCLYYNFGTLGVAESYFPKKKTQTNTFDQGHNILDRGEHASFS